jgi:hypothetical protein
VKSSTGSLVQQLQKVGTAAYQAAGPAAGPDGAADAGPGEPAGEAGENKGDEEVVEGEFKEA